MLVVRRHLEELTGPHGIYQHAPSADQPSYQAAGRAAAIVSEGALSDEEIDTFLPRSLHKTEKTAPA